MCDSLEAFWHMINIGISNINSIYLTIIFQNRITIEVNKNLADFHLRIIELRQKAKKDIYIL